MSEDMNPSPKTNVAGSEPAVPGIGSIPETSIQRSTPLYPDSRTLQNFLVSREADSYFHNAFFSASPNEDDNFENWHPDDMPTKVIIGNIMTDMGMYDLVPRFEKLISVLINRLHAAYASTEAASPETREAAND